MELSYDQLAMLHGDGIAFIELIAGSDPSTNIPACPGWSLADLAHHQGEVWNFWAHVVAEGISDRGLLRTIAVPPRIEGDQQTQSLNASLTALHTALAEAGTDREVWTWTGANRTSGWVRRRMTHETAVHRFDAARATGASYELPAAVAADGIDEFLMWFAGTERRDGELKPGGTVHLHCTDTTEQDVAGGEWFVSSLKEPNCTFTREHRKGDAAVRGRAHDILMWLWRRSTDGIEVIGDEKVARRFRAYTALD
jgi:uncharacterized protein (TIGR03083 family)